MNDPNPFGPLLQFLQDEIEKEMTEKERQMKAVVDRIAAMDRRQRFTAQEAALGGYILGYRDRHDGRKDTSNASIVARVISMALFDDELPFEVLAGTKLGDDECNKGDEPADASDRRVVVALEDLIESIDAVIQSADLDRRFKEGMEWTKSAIQIRKKELMGSKEVDKPETKSKCHFCGAEYSVSQVNLDGKSWTEVDEGCGVDRVQVEVELPCGHVERRLRVSDGQ